MTPERWRQIKDVLQEALERAPEQRSAFLEGVCSSDQLLRQEVESLLSSSDEVRSSFLRSSAVPVMLRRGTKLGEYEVQTLLGSGGMGEVYRARDLRLGRNVAIKVLPSFLSSDPDRLRRFEREAQAAAALSHPNILAVFQLGTYEGAPYLVSELLEGETVRQQMRRGLLPPRKSIDYAVQFAHGLAAAHDKGVVHRDLKPENLFLTNDGRIKILDFGLAKLVARPVGAGLPAQKGRPEGAPLQDTPTASIDPEALTEPGVVMGTVGYMAPEQVRGQEANHRADIFAFGTILYEMLTGKRAFERPTSADTMGAILSEDPPRLSQVVPNLSHALERIVHRCLEKSPELRFQSASDLAFALEAIPETAPPRDDFPSPAGSQGPPLQQPWRRALPWALAALGCAAFLITLGILWRATRFAPPTPIELGLSLPAAQQLNLADGPAAVLSPDGLRIAYVAEASAGKDQIYVRELDKPEATPLEGAVGRAPFFSPDGQWIGFSGAAGDLKRVSVFGGVPVTLWRGEVKRGGSWGEDGTIVFTPTLTDPLYRISVAGGEPVAVTHLDASRKEITHRWPQILPGGKAVLFTASSDNNNFDHAEVEAASLSTGQAKVLVENAYFGRYLPSGFLAYVSSGTLFAVPFDLKDLKVNGTAIPILPNIQADLTTGGAQLSFSQTGTATYLTGEAVSGQVTVVLMDRKGVASPLVQQPGEYFAPRFSPDGKQLALQVGVGNVWIYDLARGTMTPLTFTPAVCRNPVWTPDGKRIAFSHLSAGGLSSGISWMPSDGTGRMEPLTNEVVGRLYLYSWSPDGRILAFSQFSPKTGACCEIWALPLNPNGQPGQPKPLLGQGFSNVLTQPSFSPDGHWLAYTSNESGLPQVYVMPFPGPGGKWQISVLGGKFPGWSKAGHELFFTGLRNPAALVAVPYSVQGNSFQPGKPVTLFQGGFEARDPVPFYDVAPDGKHFAMLKAAGGKQTATTPPTIVVNWFTRVQQLVAAGQR